MKKVSTILAAVVLFGLTSCSDDDVALMEGVWELSSYEERYNKTRYLGGGNTVEVIRRSDLVDASRRWRFSLDPQELDFDGFLEASVEELEFANGDTLNYSFSVIEKDLFGSSQPWEISEDSKLILGILPRQFECTYEVTETSLSILIDKGSKDEAHTIQYLFTR